MASTSLTNTNISDTYVGVLHAEGRQLPSAGITSIYDGAGNATSIKLGRVDSGLGVTGNITTTGNILAKGNLVFEKSTVTQNVTSYPRIQFGSGDIGTNADNTDLMYITRVNHASDKSELRVNIGDNIHAPGPSTDSFTIGGTRSPSTTFIPLMTLSGDGNMIVQLQAHSTPYSRPISYDSAPWGGGITSYSFYSDGGAFGAGYGGTLNAVVSSSGDFIGKSYSSTSSIKYKTNVTPLENALNIINKLEGVRFDWKDTGKSDIGLIAESVNEVLPEFVMKDKETGEPQGVDYGKITSVLIEAVKELTKLVIK